MGNSQFQPARGHNAATGVFCRGYVDNKGDILAPQVGFEPTTLRLTAERLIAASRCKHKTYTHKKPIIALIGGTLGGLSEMPPREVLTQSKANEIEGDWTRKSDPSWLFDAPQLLASRR